jgi:WhiB family transcriptional regulator, redox-sensing transcriptional regulator
LDPILPLRPADHDEPPGTQKRLTLKADPRGGSTSWMASGACHGVDPELFFPISVTGRAMPQINSAKAVCDGCEVRPNCLSYALLTMPDGIWGGTTREERIAMRLRLARARARSRPGLGATIRKDG